MRNVFHDLSIRQGSDGISDNKWLEAGEELQVGGMVLAKGILGVAAEWFTGVAAKGGVWRAVSKSFTAIQTPKFAARPTKAEINVAAEWFTGVAAKGGVWRAVSKPFTAIQTPKLLLALPRLK
jgi:hypothetical protein